jgi:hypothetical protein
MGPLYDGPTKVILVASKKPIPLCLIDITIGYGLF